MIVSDLLLLGIEAHALADDGGFGASGAPDGEGHFKANGENALAGLTSAVAEGMPSCGEDGLGRGKGERRTCRRVCWRT